MPYKVRKVGNKYCVYNKNTGIKRGCTTKGKLKNYLANLNIHAEQTQLNRIKRGLKTIIKEVLQEEMDQNVVMRTKTVNNSLDNELNKNIGMPFDIKEKQTILFKQGEHGIKATILRNGTEIKFAICDMFNNNKITVIKKLKNMSDPNTLVYAAFFSVLPSEEPTVDQQPKSEKPENNVCIKISQPFDDKGTEKLDILGDFFEQMEVK